MKDLTEFFRSVARPFVVIWGFFVYGVCILTGVAVPDLLVGLVSAVIIEYFGERAVMRLKEK
jgi:hypothetical protein